jgi:hypothetical protein
MAQRIGTRSLWASLAVPRFRPQIREAGRELLLPSWNLVAIAMRPISDLPGNRCEVLPILEELQTHPLLMVSLFAEIE